MVSAWQIGFKFKNAHVLNLYTIDIARRIPTNKPSTSERTLFILTKCCTIYVCNAQFESINFILCGDHLSL